jgi:transcription elongation factor Elf1
MTKMGKNCPHCKKEHNFHVHCDKDNNVLCGFCGKTIFPATKESFEEIRLLLPVKDTTTYYTGSDTKDFNLPHIKI